MFARNHYTAMMTTLRVLCAVSVLSWVTVSCTSNRENNAAVSNADSALMASDTMAYNERADFKFSFTIANLPSPLNVISTIYKHRFPLTTHS